MTSACTFHGILGVQNATAYAVDRRRYWKMEGYVPLPSETEESTADLQVAVFAFGGGTPPPEDGIYFVNARLLTVTAEEETTVEMCCVDDMQLLPEGGRALPSVTVIGKVSKGSSELHRTRSFDIDITQYGIMQQQVARLRCFYPDGLRRLQNTAVPDAGKHVAVHGVLTEIEGRRCVVRVHDITLGPSDGTVDPRRKHDNAPPKRIANFNWSGKGKRSKHAIAVQSDEDSDSPRKKGKQRDEDSVHDILTESPVAGPSHSAD